MDKAKLQKQLLAIFLDELEEHTRELNRNLLTLEQDPSPPQRAQLFKLLFRSTHSLKGAAGAAQIIGIQQVCHQVEDTLTAARDGSLPLTPKVFALLFGTVDEVEQAGRELRSGRALGDNWSSAIVAKLQQAAEPSEPDASQPSGKSAESPAETAVAAKSKEPLDDRAERSPQDSRLDSQHSRIETRDSQLTPPRPAAISSTVRVTEEKVDKLLAQTGELLVARQRVETRPTSLELVRDYVTAWKSEWRSVEESLRSSLRHKRDGRPGPDHRQPVALPPHITTVLGRATEHLRWLEKELEQLVDEMVADVRQLGHASSALQDEVHRVRMLPFAEANVNLERAVRDLAQRVGKDVRLVVQGGDIEVDRAVLEALSDPLLHLVRNSIDHGVEHPDERRALGKPVQATITVSTALRGSNVEVVVSDDGRGLDLDKIRDKARKMNLPEVADDRELIQVIFLPGFSTASIITDISGRGVGMDVVKSQVEALHGTLDVVSEKGRGIRFVLTVPLTLTTIAALLVHAGGHTFAFASSNVLSLVRFGPQDIKRVQGRDTLLLGEAPMPIASLTRVLGLTDSKPQGASAQEKVPGVILSVGEQRLVVVVDDVVSERQIVVKNLGPRLRRIRLVSGATLLPSGSIALVLNAGNLIRNGLNLATARAALPTFAGVAQVTKKRLLTADDSITTRSLVKSILELAGYDVTVAVDGEDAWRRLQELDIDLVISDIEMPRMDGFALTEAIRRSSRLAKVPVVLVTGRETEADKLRGIQAGADAYLLKSAFDQTNLLETIAQLL